MRVRALDAIRVTRFRQSDAAAKVEIVVSVQIRVHANLGNTSAWVSDIRLERDATR